MPLFDGGKGWGGMGRAIHPNENTGYGLDNNVKLVMRDKDIQVWWRQLVFRFILGVNVCVFPHVLGMAKSKNCRPTPEHNFWNSPFSTVVLDQKDICMIHLYNTEQ